jgi:hypothetical protein
MSSLTDHTSECLSSCPPESRKGPDDGVGQLRAVFCATCMQLCPHALGRDSQWKVRMDRLEEAVTAPVFWNPETRPDLAPLAMLDFASLSERDVQSMEREWWSGADLIGGPPRQAPSPADEAVIRSAWEGAVVHEGAPDDHVVAPPSPALEMARQVLSGSLTPASPSANPPDAQAPPPEPVLSPPASVLTPPVQKASVPAFNTPVPPQGSWVLTPPSTDPANPALKNPGNPERDSQGFQGRGAQGSVLLGTATGVPDDWSLNASAEAAERAPLMRRGKRVVRASDGKDVPKP